MSADDTMDSIIGALRDAGLVGAGETPVFTPLTGGVSSDIHLVTAGERRFCVKRALARLKVTAVWEAPLSRNAAEAAWLTTIGRWLPHAVPTLLVGDSNNGWFAMDYLEPAAYPVWKSQLLQGVIDVDFAARVGASLATIHRRSARNPELAASFAHQDIFEPIRLEPYLRATGSTHPDLATTLNALADRTLATRIALMHGDVSPKNILAGPRGPVFLDAECACYGDPAFDLAFCLNHLLLKGARRDADRDGYLRAFAAIGDAYLDLADWEDRLALEARAAQLLPALFLARIDGKSPVEYLTDPAEHNAVRGCARMLLQTPQTRLTAIAALWSRTR